MLILAACGGGGSKATPTSAPPTAAAASPTVAASPTPDAVGAPVADGDRVLEHVRKLSVEIGPRVAGTPGEIAARDYLASTLESYGYDVTVQDFPFDATLYLPARLDFGPAPGPSSVTSIAAIAFRGSIAATVEGRHLVVAGIGRPEDFPPGGLNGDVALIERGDLTFALKVANAVAAGASAVVIYNNVPERGVFALPEGEAVAIPVVSIDQSAGQDLAEKARQQTQEVRVTVTPPRGTAFNVIAHPKGVKSCETVTGGHYDSVPVTGGADDNASGTASVLELARVVAAMKLTARHCFVLFGAEEVGLLGSKYYVSQLDEDARLGLRAMVNIDVVGTSSGLDLLGSPDIIDVARIAADDLGIETKVVSLPSNSGSDHQSFDRAGIPVVMLYREDGLIHTQQDSIERMVPASLAENVRVALGTLQKLAPEP